MQDEPANDPDMKVLSLATAQSLVAEIERLKADVVRLESHVSELEQLAHLDPLVRLPNRRGLFRDLENLIARLNRYGGSAAMIFVDIDGLKQINDRCGHPTGDAALVRIAQILVESVRASDIVGRLSGDEFIILLLDVDELGAWNMALRLVEATVASPLDSDDHFVPLSIAVGVSMIEAHDQPQDVISRADQAMYRMKAA
ncbi:MAG: GGDEF domain-containing protein [Sphingomicrobium sp.]